jgi:hypothetical protein
MNSYLLRISVILIVVLLSYSILNGELTPAQVFFITIQGEENNLVVTETVTPIQTQTISPTIISCPAILPTPYLNPLPPEITVTLKSISNQSPWWNDPFWLVFIGGGTSLFSSIAITWFNSRIDKQQKSFDQRLQYLSEIEIYLFEVDAFLRDLHWDKLGNKAEIKAGFGKLIKDERLAKLHSASLRKIINFEQNKSSMFENTINELINNLFNLQNWTFHQNPVPEIQKTQELVAIIKTAIQDEWRQLANKSQVSRY